LELCSGMDAQYTNKAHIILRHLHSQNHVALKTYAQILVNVKATSLILTLYIYIYIYIYPSLSSLTTPHRSRHVNCSELATTGLCFMNVMRAKITFQRLKVILNFFLFCNKKSKNLPTNVKH
jgi:hypothetical protein